MNIAIFASGEGSNAVKIIETLNNYIYVSEGCIKLIATNNPKAGVINIAKEKNIDVEIIDINNKSEVEAAILYAEVLKKHQIKFVILAGYLKKIPLHIIKLFPQKIVNIHPSLLPAFGGVGMYGVRVHEAVIAAKEKQSGITIHYVDEIYDHGNIIFQANCIVEEGETAATLAKKVLALEHKNYTSVIAKLINSQNDVK